MDASTIALTLLLFVGAEYVTPEELDYLYYPYCEEYRELNLTERVELLEGAPLTLEADRFHDVRPLLKYYNDMLWKVRAGAKERLYKANDYSHIARQLEPAVNILSLLEIAQDLYQPITERRLSLKAVRNMLNPADWKSGIPIHSRSN